MKKIKILTIGDGDLSFSLALKRAYPHSYPDTDGDDSVNVEVSVTATTLLSSAEELIQTYSNSKENMEELTTVWKERVLFSVDATRLMETLPSAWKRANCMDTETTSDDNISCQNKEGTIMGENDTIPKFDIVMFNHPHLGDSALSKDNNESFHALRHSSLLCHYFHSAKQILNESEEVKTDECILGNLTTSRIHICLCGSQPQTWNVMEAASRCGLTCVIEEGTSKPLDKWLFNSFDTVINLYDNSTAKSSLLFTPAKVQSHYPAPRKFRNGKLGSKHFLGKYGYRHRRTAGDLYKGNDVDMLVGHSVNFMFQLNDDDGGDNHSNSSKVERIEGKGSSQTSNEYYCDICGMIFESKHHLDQHLESPAMPDVMLPTTNNFGTDSIDDTGRDDGNTYNHQMEKSSNTKRETMLENKNSDIEISEILASGTLAEAKVEKELHGKRLRWYCRQPQLPFTKYIKSKKNCEEIIKAGRVLVNGSLALDSSRILKSDDVVRLLGEVSNDVATVGNKHSDLPIKRSHSSIAKDGKKDNSEIMTKNNINHGVKVIKYFSIQKKDEQFKFTIVFKPPGIRTVGSFSDQTLEMITANLLISKSSTTKRIQCKAITRLDTGCAGLCILLSSYPSINETSSKQKEMNNDHQQVLTCLDVTYKLTALVHGSVPDEWNQGVFMKLPKHGSRRWKRQRNDDDNIPPSLSSDIDKMKSKSILDKEVQEEEESQVEISFVPKSLTEWAFVKCEDRVINQQNTNLSTLSITSKYDSGRLSNVICFTLRRLNYPVVNDRFCKREYAALPRQMRNIIKHKLCVGCYSLEYSLEYSSVRVGSEDFDDNEQVIKIPLPERLSCLYWRQLLSS